MTSSRTFFRMLTENDLTHSDDFLYGSPKLLNPSQKAELLNFPLIAPHNTALNLDRVPLTGKKVYFGTGIATSKALGRELPFDFLGMLLTAEWIRRKTKASEIIHEISDAHALTNPIHNRADIIRIAQKQREQYTQVAMALGMDDFYRCVLASEYRASKAFANIQEEVDRLSPADAPPYMRYQSAGNLYFARHENVGCKVGWLVDDDETPTGLDERTFNYAYAKLGVKPLTFLYTWSGWNFDPRRSRVSPYTVVQGEKRLMLASKGSAVEELRQLAENCDNEKICRMAIIHIARIVEAYDILFSSKKPAFWRNDILETSSGFIEITKPESWHIGQYIDLELLARRIDEIRTFPAQAFDTNLLSAVQQYIAERQSS